MTARLLGDVGGTNARFAWQEADGTPLRDKGLISEEEYQQKRNEVLKRL